MVPAPDGAGWVATSAVHPASVVVGAAHTAWAFGRAPDRWSEAAPALDGLSSASELAARIPTARAVRPGTLTIAPDA